MQALLDVILPVFLVIGAGYFAVLRGYFAESGVEALMKFTQNFAIPCLLFKAMATIDLNTAFNPPLLLSYYAGAVSAFFLGMFAARAFFGRPWTDAVAIGFACMFSNSVLLGLPITERAYGMDALVGNYAIIALNAPVCYVLGITAMELVRSQGLSLGATALRAGKAIFQNVLIFALGLGLLVNLLNVPIPGVLTDAVDLLSRAALPAALFALGGELVRLRPEGDVKVIAMICCIALVILPLISLTLATAFDLNTDAFRSVVLTAAMAPGVNAYIFAKMYGVATRVVATSVLSATGLSVFSVWAWLLFIP